MTSTGTLRLNSRPRICETCGTTDSIAAAAALASTFFGVGSGAVDSADARRIAAAVNHSIIALSSSIVVMEPPGGPGGAQGVGDREHVDDLLEHRPGDRGEQARRGDAHPGDRE